MRRAAVLVVVLCAAVARVGRKHTSTRNANTALVLVDDELHDPPEEDDLRL